MNDSNNHIDPNIRWFLAVLLITGFVAVIVELHYQFDQQQKQLDAQEQQQNLIRQAVLACDSGEAEPCRLARLEVSQTWNRILAERKAQRAKLDALNALPLQSSKAD